jgi:hypothetical protein
VPAPRVGCALSCTRCVRAQLRRMTAREPKVAARLGEIAHDRRALRNALDRFAGAQDFASVWASEARTRSTGATRSSARTSASSTTCRRSSTCARRRKPSSRNARFNGFRRPGATRTAQAPSGPSTSLRAPSWIRASPGGAKRLRMRRLRLIVDLVNGAALPPHVVGQSHDLARRLGDREQRQDERAVAEHDVAVT